MKKSTWIIIISVIAVIVLLLIGKRAGWLGKDDKIKVAVERASKRSITESIPANGKIQPVVQVKISPDVSGEIVELNVKEGQYVEKGKLLLKIKPEVYSSALNRMEASLNSTKSRLEQIGAQVMNLEAVYKRTEKLYKDNVVSQSDFEDVESQYKAGLKQLEAARFDVKSAQASVDEAKENLNKTSIYAPMSGTVSALNVERGERVVGTSQMAGTEMLRIANLEAMEALVDVNENDIVNVKLNDTAIIEVDAYPGKTFRGLVTEVANSATATAGVDQVTNFQVKVYILPESYDEVKSETNPNPLRPGMSTSASIQTKTHFEALSIPIQAITTRSDLTTQDTTRKDIKTESTYNEYVFVLSSDSVSVKQIKTGIQDNDYIEVLSGLNEGDELVTQPYTAISKRLKSGSKVAVTPVDQLK